MTPRIDSQLSKTIPMMVSLHCELRLIRRTYRYRLYPTHKQRVASEAQLAFVCERYNAALEQRRDALARSAAIHWLRGPVSGRDGHSGPWHGTARDELSRHARPVAPPGPGFAAFFRRLMAGEKPGYPRFRSRRRYDSLTWDQWVLRGGRLSLPGIGHLKVRWHRPLPGDADLRTVTVRRHARHWYVCFALERPKPVPFPTSGESVGLDLGIRTFGALSTGELLAGPRAVRAAQRRLR